LSRQTGELTWIKAGGAVHFPAVDQALDSPNGLLAAGGDLAPQRLISAYRQGIFPWYEAGQPILWWSPDPRAVLFPERLHVARTLRRSLRDGTHTVTFDRAFDTVVQACTRPRPRQSGQTWITAEMFDAYRRLHHLGVAHSVEVWQGERLVGGLYGLALGAAFFGESMFSRVSDASKVALVWLSRQLQAWDYHLIDCQVSSAHLQRLGAIDMPREDFLRALAIATALPRQAQSLWCFEHGFHPLAGLS
jgi:leucyl/phenylalanyl-tRNA---protein transferase